MFTFYVNFSATIVDHINEVEPNYICPQVNSALDDLPVIDMIHTFKLDYTDFDHSGIKKVLGSNDMQTAFRISKRSKISLPTR